MDITHTFPRSELLAVARDELRHAEHHLTLARALKADGSDAHCLPYWEAEVARRAERVARLEREAAPACPHGRTDGLACYGHTDPGLDCSPPCCVAHVNGSAQPREDCAACMTALAYAMRTGYAPPCGHRWATVSTPDPADRHLVCPVCGATWKLVGWTEDGQPITQGEPECMTAPPVASVPAPIYWCKRCRKAVTGTIRADSEPPHFERHYLKSGPDRGMACGPVVRLCEQCGAAGQITVTDAGDFCACGAEVVA